MIKCVMCSQEVSSRRGLSFHIKKHGIDSIDKYLELYPDQQSQIEPINEELLTCPICNKHNMKQLSQHITWVHKMTQEEFLSLYPNQKLFIDEISDRCRKASQIGVIQYYQNKENNPEKYEKMIQERTLKRIKNNPDIGSKVSKILREHGVYDRLSDRVKKMWQDEDYRKLQSDKAKKQHENGLTDIIADKSGKKRYKVKIGDVEYSMRSTWEVMFAEFLYENNIDFLYEPLTIDYEYNGKVRKYYPDFIIPNTNILFEVKPKGLIYKPMNEAKRQASIKAGYDFRYITEEELDNIESINPLDVK